MKYTAREELYRKAGEENIPLSASIDLTYRCNLKCVHCYTCPTDEKELTFNEVVSVIDQLADAGGLHLKLIGGEPMVRKDFFDIAFYARKRGFALVIFTNGTLVTRASARRIAQLYPETVLVSLYGASEDSYAKTTGNPRAFRRALSGISYLGAQKVRQIVVSHSFNFYPQAELARMKRISEQQGAKWILTTGFTARSDGDPSPLKYAVSHEQLKAIFKRFPQTRVKRSPGSRTLGRVCTSTGSRVHIDAYGHVGRCPGLTSRDTIRERPLMDIWRNDPLLTRLRDLKFADLKKCLACESLPYCLPCPGANFMSTGNLCVPSEAVCAAKHRIRECSEVLC